MTTPYFRQLPDFDYVNRNPKENTLNDYVTVKNLFKRGKIRDDILENLAFFNKYIIVDGDRPDTLANTFYDDSSLDWIILIANNILNVQTEWPMSQDVFDAYLLDKYDTYEKIYDVHHYETPQILDSQGITIIPKGLIVDEDYSIEYYDQDNLVIKDFIAEPITNYEYEVRLEDKKRTIYILKPIYLNTIKNDMMSIMEYKKGSGQYVSRTLKRGEDINLFN